MFRCHSATARKAVKEGLKTMEKVFRKDNIPSGTARSFMNKVKQATADPSPEQPFSALKHGPPTRLKMGLAQWQSCEAITTSSGTTPERGHTGNAPNPQEQTAKKT